MNSGTQPGGAGGSTADVNPAEDGRGSPGSGASPDAGGAAGPASTATGNTLPTAGMKLLGGNGGADPVTGTTGGGGGGGYYGGGGGGATGTGGGGGSSFVISTAMDRLTLGGAQGMPGKAGDPHRGDAGAVGGNGAVIVIPQ